MEDLERLTKALADRYRIEREIGSGGMATVFLAQDLKHERQVAVKVLNPDLAQTLGVERFLREIKTAANLTHPHILPLFDSGEADGFLFYVMPHVKGESLRARLTKEKQLPVEDAVQITREIADALAYAHEEGVIHRDVKPANIMLEAGHAVLADFGVAHAVAEAKDERITRTGTSLGTPSYMSPEQATVEQDLDGRSDQYALGCVLYEMLAGHPPFTGAQVEAVVRQHLTEEPPSVTQARPSVTEEVVRVINRALAKNPADRFKTTGEMAAALALTTTPAPSFARGLPKPAVIGVGALFALGLFGLAYAVFSWSERSDLIENRVLVVVFENETGDPSLDSTGRILVDQINQGLMRTGLFVVVPTPSSLSLAESLQGGSAEPWRWMADETRAGLVVTGEYYLQGDQVRLQGHLTDAREGSLISSPPAVVGPLDSIMVLGDELVERVTVALASRFDSRFAGTEGLVHAPPKKEAYTLYLEGVDEMYTGSGLAAHQRFVSAAELDPSFLKAVLMAGLMGVALTPPPPGSDTLLQKAEESRQHLSEGDKALLDYGWALANADPEAGLRSIRRAMEADPEVPGLREYWAGWLEWWLNRPGEALEFYEMVEVDQPGIGQFHAYWANVFRAHYHLGNLERALDALRRGEKITGLPTRLLLFRSRALAGLGEIEPLEDGLPDLLANFPSSSTEIVLPGVVGELRAHGHGAAVPGIVDQALAWLDTRPATEKQSTRHRRLMAGTLLSADRFGEAEALFRDLVTENPNSVSLSGHLGISAAKGGNREEAERVTQLFSEMEPLAYGMRTIWLVRIAASQGDREGAVGFLQQAIDEGYAHWVDLQSMIGLESLWDYPPFQELIRPKG